MKNEKYLPFFWLPGSPYAVSSRNDLAAAETVYSLVMNPGEAPSAACSFPQGNSGGNVRALYWKVLKDKSGLSLASESSMWSAWFSESFVYWVEGKDNSPKQEL